MNTKTINIQVLALLGDAVLSLYIREKLLKQGINNANKLNASAVPYVSAKGQVKILDKLTKDNFLTEEELDIVKRGRNNKKENHPKNTDIITYKLSTGFEALLGDLYLNNKDRLKAQIIKCATISIKIKSKHCKNESNNYFCTL